LVWEYGIVCLLCCTVVNHLNINFQSLMMVLVMFLAGYISQVLKNYTDHACDGEYVSLRCPHRTTISIQSSFYGRIVPSHQMCPSRYPHSYATLIKEDVACSVGTSLQKMLDECQDRRSCQFLVNSRLFGADPCPGTGKYLMVWYKCRPNEYKSKVACEDDKLRLRCKKSMVIAIYSAIFGRTQGGSLECPYQKCQSTTALQLMIKRCHGKRSCSIYASTYEFGDPCYPGIRKHLNVIYTCGEPQNSLTLTVTGVFISHQHSLKQAPKLNSYCNGSAVLAQGTCVCFKEFSSLIIIFFPLPENPERAALYFVSGVCIGLVLTLLALVLRVSCRTDCKRSSAKKPPRERDSDSDSSDSDDYSDTTSDLSARRHRRFERTLNMNVFTSAEELERAQRLEERERIIREIWMNGQPDIPGTRSLNRYY
uniref:SUEL-type lectin domain-containing protein n=1 Tax=Apteryx owenii TaxID=8824 RepID=A0A8B9Q873_APTOW